MNIQNEDQLKKIQKAAKGRQPFKFQGQTIYEWEQNLEEVLIYIKPPPAALPKNRALVQAQLKPGQTLPRLEVKIARDSLRVGIKGTERPYIHEKFLKEIQVEDSLWTIEDDELVVTLLKCYKGEVWSTVFVGHEVMNPLLQEAVQKNMLLERFQQENPNFDFSQAEMNGNVPDPREFMGGLDYSR